MTTGKYILLGDTAFFDISGKERDLFLQGLITNDINKCLSNKAIYAAFLTPQGKFIADFFILNLGNSFLFEVNEKLKNEVLKKFNIYKLRSEISISENNKYTSLSINTNLNYFNDLQPPGECQKIDEGFVFVDPRKTEMGIKAIIEKSSFDKFVNRHNLSEEPYTNYNNLRIENLIPDSLQDLEVNKSLLLENNFDLINAIDWEKGCYVGQEITARMKHRSLLKKSLYKILITEGHAKKNDRIFLNEKNIGNVTSVCNDRGLAMLKINEAISARKNNIKLNSENSKIKITN